MQSKQTKKKGQPGTKCVLAITGTNVENFYSAQIFFLSNGCRWNRESSIERDLYDV